MAALALLVCVLTVCVLFNGQLLGPHLCFNNVPSTAAGMSAAFAVLPIMLTRTFKHMPLCGIVRVRMPQHAAAAAHVNSLFWRHTALLDPKQRMYVLWREAVMIVTWMKVTPEGGNGNALSTDI